MEVATYRLLVTGLVQGVGFRPFIFRLATKHGLSGQVENRNDGVVIDINTAMETVLCFRDDIIQHAPEASSIENIEISEQATRAFSSFEIIKSENISDGVTEISPDIAVCREFLNYP